MSDVSINIDRLGVSKCNYIFEKIGLAFREQQILDYGIDALIETKNKDYFLGKLIAVQIKSGESYFKEVKGNNVVFRIQDKHYKYWINHCLPVIIVLYSPQLDKCIWEVFTEEKAIKCRTNWKINIPFNNDLEKSYEKILNIANRVSEYDRRWNTLIIAKGWMNEIKKNGNAFLEVSEWVNKSSGKGDFKLIIKKGSKSKIIFERELFGFGLKKYEKVIQELFPWAKLEIDQEFYSKNIDEICQTKYLESERDFLHQFGIYGERLLEYSGEYPKLYPYKIVAGEVGLYRIIVSLNSLGESFLEIENFLQNGKCYYVQK